MRVGRLTIGLLGVLAWAASAPSPAMSQDRLNGSTRRIARITAGFPGNGIVGVDLERGVGDNLSFVTSGRRWGFGYYDCVRPGPVLDERANGAQPDYAPCTPDGWSISAGLRGAASVFFAEVDVGLYRYDHDQVFAAPYGGLRTGLAPQLWSTELQLALHLLAVSSYNGSGFDPDSWLLGAFEIGLGIPLS